MDDDGLASKKGEDRCTSGAEKGSYEKMVKRERGELLW